MCNRTRNPQFSNFSGMQSAPNRILAVEEGMYDPLIGQEDFLWTKKQQAMFGSMVGKSSRQPYAQQGLGSESILPGPLLPALDGAPMDVIHHSDIGTQNTMTEVTNHIQVLLNLTGSSEHFCPQYNECVMDMKAEMGSVRKAMFRSGISFDKLPNEQKQKDTSTNGRQKKDFAGTAKKKNRKDKVAQRSLVAVDEKDSVSDSNEDAQPEFEGVAIVRKPQKHLSPLIMNAQP
jgi:hypothetical protein